MEQNLMEHLVRFFFLSLSIGVAILLGHFRPEWKSRKTLISWVWTIAAIDIIIMDHDLAKSFSAQLIIGGALILNIINFIGDRIETIKYKDFSASLRQEEDYHKKHSIKNKSKKNSNKNEWPDGGLLSDQESDPPELLVPKRRK